MTDLDKLKANLKWLENFSLSKRTAEKTHEFIGRMSVLREIAIENTKLAIQLLEA